MKRSKNTGICIATFFLSLPIAWIPVAISAVFTQKSIESCAASDQSTTMVQSEEDIGWKINLPFFIGSSSPVCLVVQKIKI